MEVSENYYAVILAGGGGTRLWPKSRQKTPKHLVKIIGDKTLIRQTFERIVPLIPIDRILVITREEQADLVKKELPEIPDKNIIKEPISKNTALAMGVAASYVRSRDENGVIINLAADQTIGNKERFREVISGALDTAAASSNIVAVGIKPTFPHTGFGYIKIGKELESKGRGLNEVFVFESAGFKEKPDLATASSFIASKEYLWNANLYCWSVKTVFDAFKKDAPDLFDGINQVYEALKGSKENGVLGVLNEVYEKSENIQIDVAVSEKADNIVVIPGDFSWSDVGDWRVVYDSLPKDLEGNVLGEGSETINIDSKNCLVEGDGRLIVTVGLQDIIIVDTPDAILVCKKDKTQDVKKAVEFLKEHKKEKYL